jgi:hypothetical protein
VTSQAIDFRKPFGLTVCLYFRLSRQATTLSNCQPISHRLPVKWGTVLKLSSSLREWLPTNIGQLNRSMQHHLI